MSHHEQGIPHAAKPRAVKVVDHHIGLDPDEQVLLMARMHWVIFRDSLFVGLFIPFVLISVYLLLTQVDLGEFEQFSTAVFWSVVAISATCFVLGMTRFLWHLHHWHHTMYVMTSKKLAIISRNHPWNRNVQQIALNNINDVTLHQEGFEAFMYGYADVTAITFSGSHFTFEHVAQAPAVQKAIMQQLAQLDRPTVVARVDETRP